MVLARPACSRRAGVPELVAGIIFRSGFDVVLTPLGLAPTAVSVRSDPIRRSRSPVCKGSCWTDWPDEAIFVRRICAAAQP